MAIEEETEADFMETASEVVNQISFEDNNEEHKLMKIVKVII